MYFNLEAATVLLCAWTFVWVNALGVSMQRILLLFKAARLSYRALVPALLSFYPFFYVSAVWLRRGAANSVTHASCVQPGCR